MTYTYRLARTHDYPTVLELDEMLFPESYRETPQMGNVYWLALTSPESLVVGYAAARQLRQWSEDVEWERSCFLTRVGVLPSARGQGLQKRFVRARLRWAREEGYSRAVTYVSPWASVWSIRTLVRCGFLPYEPKWHWAGSVMYLEREL